MSADGSAPSSPARPGAVTAIGILNILIGGASLLCLTCAGCAGGFIAYSLSTLPNSNGPDPSTIFTNLDRDYPLIKLFVILVLVWGILNGLLLAISGFGLLKLRPAARKLAIITACSMITFDLVSCVYSIVQGNAAMLKWLDETQRFQVEAAKKQGTAPPPAMALPSDPAALAVSNIISMCIEIIYPGIVIWIMRKRNVLEAFGAVPPEPVEVQEQGWGDVADAP